MNPFPSRKPWATGTTLSYLVAVAASAAATGLTLFLEETGVPNLLLLFLFAVVLVTTFEGPGPGTLCAALTLAAATFLFKPPLRSFDLSHHGTLARLGLYGVASAATLLLTLALRRTRERLLRELAERRRAEEEVRRLNEGLETRVRERTAELDSFAYSVAHDLRAPLRSLAGLSQILREDYVGKPLDEGARDLLRRIEQSACRMDALTMDLLTYSRVGREEVALETVDVGALVDKLVRELTPELEARKGRIQVERPLPPVRGHSLMLSLAINNLLGNAIKFVPPGTAPDVRVRAEKEGPRARIWVEDNGIGIPKEYQAYIFGVFHRLHKADDFPGTGIGLAIVDKTVHRMGGEVGVESEPGRGSRFWIKLQSA